MPSSDVLRRAMELWGIELVYRHRKLTVVDLQSQTEDSALSRPKSVQLELWESIKTLESDAISVRVEKKSPQSITLQVQIGFKG